jgi:hypothetical protein
MSLIQKLFKGKLDIIGDVHGELDALKSLVQKLGYDKDGNHPEGRKLIFVGDLVDRGPDSPGVVRFVKNLISRGNAQMVLGNHELNVLQHKAKSGAGWYFEQQVQKDKDYHPFATSHEASEKREIYDFLSSLPLALENDELRIVHAAWINEKIEIARKFPLGSISKTYLELEQSINENIRTTGLLQNYHLEQEEWAEELEDPYAEIPFLEYTCQYNLAHQMNNPLRVLTSGVEKRTDKHFFASGKWRFIQRDNWWDNYNESTPVVVGHFWRKFNAKKHGKAENVFAGIAPNAWHGKNKNVFCVDYSVGARFLERKNKVKEGTYGRLGALRWPEKELYFEDGSCFKTE